MDAIATRPPRAAGWALPRTLVARVDPPALAAWTLAFTVVTYVALRDGGYDTIVRSDAAVAVWWFVLLGAAAGTLPARFGAAAWVAIALLGGFAVWTGLAIGWSESAERSVVELGRIAAYLGVLVLAVALQGKTAARHMLTGVACAIGFVTVLAVLSRLHPQAFPVNDHFRFLGSPSARRLSYPLNYWNALAGFVAIGMPLLLAVAIGARTLVGRAAAAATLPLGALCVYFTISRGGVLALGVGLAAFLILVPHRLDAIATLVPAAAGAAILIVAGSQRSALLDGLPTRTAIDQGTEVLWLALLVCGGVALLQVAIGLAARHVERPVLLRPSARATAFGALATLAVVGVVAGAAGAPGTLRDRWNQFTAPDGLVTPASDATVLSRLEATNGNGRYEFWQAAVRADQTRPWTGIGPGTFEFWWARHPTTGGFVRNAHSLWFETLAETGIVGLALMGGMFLWLMGVAIARSLRAPADLRVWIAAAAGGVAAFVATAALEWVWQLATIACAVMILAAVIVAGRGESERPAAAPGRAPRVLFAVLAVAALAAVLLPLAGASAIRASQRAAAEGDLKTALRDSATAIRLQPWAATPHLQQALLFESAGQLAPASTAARAATTDEPTNWRTWLVRARIDAKRSATQAAVAELRRARSLNPRSTLFLAR